MLEDTAAWCMTTMYMWLTNISSLWINSICTGHSAGIVVIIKDLWIMKSILVTNLIWVTWNPSVSRWRVSFCFTVKSYSLLNTNKIFCFKFNNLRWICISISKIKIIKKQHLHKYVLRKLSPIAKKYIQEVIVKLVSCSVSWIDLHVFANNSPTACVRMWFQWNYYCLNINKAIFLQSWMYIYSIVWPSNKMNLNDFHIHQLNWEILQI